MCNPGPKKSVSTFMNDASLERILYGLIDYWNRKYAVRPCREFRRPKKWPEEMRKPVVRSPAGRARRAPLGKTMQENTAED